MTKHSRFPKNSLVMVYHLLAVIFVLGLGFTLLGCGQAENTATTTTMCTTTTATSSTTSTTTAGCITMSGSLYSGTFASASIQHAGSVRILATEGSPIQGYNIAVVGSQDKKMYYASSSTSTSGAFSVPNLPSNQSYYVEILDDNNRLAAPVSFATSGSQVIMAVSPEGQADLPLGKIIFESSEGAATPTIEPTANLDTAAVANTKSGKPRVPVGAGNFGKGSDAHFSETYDFTKRDGDKDGLPDAVDADNNSDGYVDEIDGLFTNEAIGSGEEAGKGAASLFVNLKIQYQYKDSFSSNYENYMVLTMLVTPLSSKLNQVENIQLISGPDYMSKMKIHRQEGATYPPDYPEDNSLWSAVSYNLYLMTSEASYYTAFIKGLKPYSGGSGDIKVGDVFKFKVSYSDGASDYFTKMINYYYTDIPRLLSYKTGSGSWITAPTTTEYAASSPNAPTSKVHLRWSRPKDENSNEIIGAKYTWEYSPALAGGTSEDVIIQRGEDVGTTTSLEGTDDFAGKLSAGDNFSLGICIRSEANDNSSQSLVFTRGW